MSQLIKTELFQQIKRSSLLQFQRYRGKINIQRPQKPHYERARVTAVTTPRYPQPPKTNTCFGRQTRTVGENPDKATGNPYEDIIAREVRNWFDHSKVVAIFHLNSIKADDLFDVRVKLHKQNMQLKMYGHKIVRKAFNNDSPYKALLPLFVLQPCIVFSQDNKISQLIKITRKVPQMILLAGIVDDTLLSRNEIINYAQIANLQSVQTELVHTINTAGSSLVQNLEATQNYFVNVLDMYVERKLSESSEVENVVNMQREND